MDDLLQDLIAYAIEKKASDINVIKLRNDEPSRYYCLDGIFI